MLVAGQQVPRLLTSIPSPAYARVPDAHDKTGLAIVRGGTVADYVDIDRTARQYRGVATTGARSAGG